MATSGKIRAFQETHAGAAHESSPPTWVESHFAGISAVALAFFCLYWIFKKGMERGKAQALRELKDDLQGSMAALEKAFGRSSLVPHGHALISCEQETFSRHQLSNGYVMRVEGRFEHRAVAESILGRELASNEIVHHIYGPAKNDNSPGNLCVLDREQHDLFHTFIEREKRLKGRYPRISEQKSLLKRHFHGILLEEALENKTFAYSPIVVKDSPELPETVA